MTDLTSVSKDGFEFVGTKDELEELLDKEATRRSLEDKKKRDAEFDEAIKASLKTVISTPVYSSKFGNSYQFVDCGNGGNNGCVLLCLLHALVTRYGLREYKNCDPQSLLDLLRCGVPAGEMFGEEWFQKAATLVGCTLKVHYSEVISEDLYILNPDVPEKVFEPQECRHEDVVINFVFDAVDQHYILYLPEK